jgi:AhpD family alkylhydroperoxidase
MPEICPITLKQEKMQTRVNIQEAAPEAYKAMFPLQQYLATTAVTATHKDLILIRASQINGCAHCINMHTADARKRGETEQRIYLTSVWRETDLFTEEEKAILALTEQVTLIANHISDDVYQNAVRLFDPKYVADAIMMIITINAWNRIAISSGYRVS